MTRVTKKDMQRSLATIREMTGTPEMRWTPHPKQGNACPVGAYYIEQGSPTYGIWWKLVQTCNDGGGIRTVLSSQSAAGLHAMLGAWIAGFAQCRETMSRANA